MAPAWSHLPQTHLVAIKIFAGLGIDGDVDRLVFALSGYHDTAWQWSLERSGQYLDFLSFIPFPEYKGIRDAASVGWGLFGQIRRYNYFAGLQLGYDHGITLVTVKRYGTNSHSVTV